MTKTPLESVIYQFLAPKQVLGAIASTTIRLTAIVSLTALSFCVNPALAGDPFRSSNPHPIGNKTEAAFKAMFEQGNYVAAKAYVEQALSAEPNDPLVYAMKASLSYIDQDLEGLNAYAKKTREVAEKLSKTDSLRGNIYIAAGYFLEGAYTIAKEGTAKGTSQAMNKLRQVFQYLDVAEKIAPTDPELNLVRGYMDLMLATNLPFSNPNQAIQRLEQKASPRYLADRGIAVGYRDLDKYDQALNSVNKALAATPNNPEVLYLKAQILVSQARRQNNNRTLFDQARKNFDAALAKPSQLPRRLVAQIFFEQCKTRNRLDNGKRACDPMRDAIRDGSGSWGPVALPPL
ncbi:MAG TPA: Sll0314/Alr1548 family TPR repeat-containing protein [Kamptonema sp.]|nr:Sll0314/Alr1548 family TPR repeat-containing protein [Kamptonema sp.]